MRRFVLTMAVLWVAAASVARADERANEAVRVAAEACYLCHPPLEGGSIAMLNHRPAGELLRLLLAFRDGSRPATVMDRLARGYTPQELGAIAGELARQGGEGGP